MTFTTLITGANRGIGLEFVRQFSRDGWRVHACCRKPDQAEELNHLASDCPERIRVHRLEVTDWNQVQALAAELQGTAIDILINNAGVPGQTGSRFGNIDPQIWLQTLQVNALAPMKMMEAFAAAVEASQRRLIINIGSKMGSMTDNTSGGAYVYRSSKAALNAISKSAAIDLRERGITVAVLHPGWVKTDMGGPRALITPEESVRHMRQLFQRLTEADSGGFFNYDGTPIPW